MPFEKITSGPMKGKFRSPSGRVFTLKQVKLIKAKEASGEIKTRGGKTSQ